MLKRHRPDALIHADEAATRGTRRLHRAANTEVHRTQVLSAKAGHARHARSRALPQQFQAVDAPSRAKHTGTAHPGHTDVPLRAVINSARSQEGRRFITVNNDSRKFHDRYARLLAEVAES